MSWYREGTINLTNGSKTVTGTGTAWLENVVASSGLKTPIGSEEIESVTSNTSLQLVMPYTGPTVNSIAYAVIPTQGLVPALTKKATQLLSTIGVMKDAYEAGDLADQGDLATAVKKVDLAAAGGAATVGAARSTSSTGLTLGPSNLTVFVRSSAIDVREALPGNFVTDASVNYTVQVQKILDYLKDFGGGRLLLPPNLAILAGGLIAYSGTEIVAPDWTSQIVVPAGSNGISVNPGAGGTTNPDDNQRNIYMSGFQLRGQAATPTFLEQRHLLNINAISSSLFEDLLIKGFQGDGIYLGSSNTFGVERHNERITFRNLRIDGVNRNNRNGLSIIDGTDIVIDGFSAYRTTRSDMPSAIDIEPNHDAYARIRNITMENLYIEDCRGGVFVIVSTNMTIPVSRVSVRDFKMINVDTALGATGSYNVATITKADTSQNVLFEQGSAKNGVLPLAITGQRGFKMRDVAFENFTGSAIVGSGVVERELSVGVSIRDTEWVRCGSTSGSAVKVDGITDFDYVGNRHIDCGNNTVNGAAVELAPVYAGALKISAFSDNEFDKSALTNMQAVRKTGAGSVAYDYLDVGHNKFNGLASVFLDDRDTAYTPSVIGGSVAGTATYSARLGRYVRRGKTVSVSIGISWSGHTGTGGIQVTLPMATAAGIQNIPCTVALSSVPWTAGSTVRAVVVSGTAVIQLLQEAPGAASTGIPMSASGTVNLAVEYPIA